MRRASVSEFPNDNPLLHDGAIWVQEEPCGPLAWMIEDEPASMAASATGNLAPAGETPALHPSRAPAPVSALLPAPPCVPSDLMALVCDADDTEPSAPPVVEIAANDGELDDGAADFEVPAQTTPPPPPDPFEDFVEAMVSIASAEGAHSVAAALPLLLDAQSVACASIDDSTIEAAVTAGFVVRAGERLLASEKLTSLVRGWQCVLRAGDFSACGASMLNEWAAELLAALLTTPERAQALQYELRRRGVAAFGMVRLAA